MKIIHLTFAALIALFFFPAAANAQHGYAFKEVPFSDVKIDDAFWSKWLERHITGTIPNAINQITNPITRLANFEIAAGVKKGKYRGWVWDDSDMYKVMEGMAYSLQNHADPALEKVMDHWVDLVAKSQEPNGYLVTYYILNKDSDQLGKNLGPWSDIGRHEMYDGGHLIEAAVAYYQATGKRQLLDVAIKLANNWMDTFQPRHWLNGHEGAELALVKLYAVTKDKRYLEFAHWLLEERGHGHEYGPMVEFADSNSNLNIQNEMPVKDLTIASGHAVRAMYLYSGMADVLANSGDSTYLKALNSIWDDMNNGKVYITGGIGASRDGERFGANYHLPNKDAYCETCASVGVVMWSSRMNRLYGNAKYANMLERTLYNALLAGVSLDGSKVSYTNTLESEGKHHNRDTVYGTACCPSNIARFLPAVGSYIYLTRDNEVLVNLYIGSETKLSIGSTPTTIVQKTDYPYNGRIAITVNPESAVQGKIKLRIPDWCKSYSASLNGKKISGKDLENGYLTMSKEWKKGDGIIINLDMPVVLDSADARTADDVGRRTVQKGPLVYAIEQADNPGLDIQNITLTSKNTFKVVPGDGVLKGINKLQTTVGKDKVTFIPYYAWDNRELGKMLVWVKYSN
jgi:DUF1680 family protein